MGEKQAEDEKDPSGWWGHTSKLCKAVNCGRSARGEPTPSPTSHQLPGGHCSPSHRKAQLSSWELLLSLLEYLLSAAPR